MRIKNFMRSYGAKILHDSGNRVIVIETDREPEEIVQRLPKGVTITPPDKAAKAGKERNEHDELFVKALKLRASNKYRRMKDQQVPGESPEEKLLVTGSCETED
ncbi:MAG: hypothetical protein HKN11_02785 [Rhizobiales bacterium]|nr:hypothetical protein [Hyphomicrobiales bacterium]